MKMLVLGAVVAGALFLTTAIAGEQAAAPAEPAQATEAGAPKPAADEKVCTMEKSLGSNMKKRVCRTRAQYEAERERAREALDRTQQGSARR